MTIVEDDSSSSEEIQADQPPVKENKVNEIEAVKENKANEIKDSSNDAEKCVETKNETETLPSNPEASTENTNSSSEDVKVSEPVKEAKLPQNIQVIKDKADGLLRFFLQV